MRRYVLYLAAAVTLAAGCDSDQEEVLVAQPGLIDLAKFEGAWVGQEEITVAEDIGFGSQDRGFSFPVVLLLRSNRQFELITTNFPTSYDDEESRVCRGIYSVEDDATVQFFATSTCRALPLTKFQMGPLFPAGMTLEASTGRAAFSGPGTIKVRMRLARE